MAVQRLVASGHSWLDIKQYTLSEFGIFLSVLNKIDKENKVHDITTAWLGTNLSKEGLDSVLKDLSGKTGVTVEEHNNAVKGLQKLAAIGR